MRRQRRTRRRRRRKLVSSSQTVGQEKSIIKSFKPTIFPQMTNTKSKKRKRSFHQEDFSKRRPKKKRRKEVKYQKIEFTPEQTLHSVDPYAPNLQNTVSVINTKTPFQHRPFVECFKECEFLLHKFAATTFRIEKGATALLYNTGKLICVGSRTLIESKIVSTKYLGELGRVKERKFIKDPKTDEIVDITFQSISERIQCNHVDTENTDYKCCFKQKEIYLNELQQNNPEIMQYSPEAFPGGRIHGQYATYLVFQEGCCLILGISDPKNLPLAYEEIHALIKESILTKKSRDKVSKYIWNRIHQKNTKLTVSLKDGDDDDINNNLILSKTLKMNKNKNNKITSHKKSNFHQRLERCYGLYGSYNDSNGDITHNIVEKVRNQITLSSFSKLVHPLFSNHVLC